MKLTKRKLPRAPLPKQRSEPHRVKKLEKKPKHKLKEDYHSMYPTWDEDK